MSVTSTTFLANAKIVYGMVKDQVSSYPAFMNLLKDGTKFARAKNDIGLRGYVFEARLRPNFNMGFRPESASAGVGTSGNQGLGNATVLLKYGYVPETITGQALNLTKSEATAFMKAKALEISYSTKDMVSHMNVLAVGADRGGQLASVAAAPAPTSTVFYADNTSGFPGAIYLRVGMPIDTYTVGGEASPAIDGETITDINYETRAVTKTTTTGTADAADAVCLGGEACTTAQYPTTMEGLISLVSDSGAMQGLNPATSGEESWASYVEDVAGDDLTSSMMHRLKTFIKNRSGYKPDIFIFPSAQINQMVKFATENYRFQTQNSRMGKKALDLGFDVYEYAGMPIIEDKDARPDRIFCGNSDCIMRFEALPLALADDAAGEWTRLNATTGVVDAVVALLRTYINLGITCRSAWGYIKGLSVDDAFTTQAITI